jgi:predicted DNA-binding protein
MVTMKGKRVLTSLYLDPEVQADLKRLSAYTRVPVAAYLREAVADLLKKHAADLRRAKK